MDHGRRWFSRGGGDHGFRWEGKWRDEAMAMPITPALTWWREEHTLGDDLAMWISLTTASAAHKAHARVHWMTEFAVVLGLKDQPA